MNPVALAIAAGWAALGCIAFFWARSFSRSIARWIVKNFVLLLLAVNTYVAAVTALDSQNLTPDSNPLNLLGLDLLIGIAVAVPTLIALLTVSALTARTRGWARRLAAVGVFVVAGALAGGLMFANSHEASRGWTALFFLVAGFFAGILLRLPPMAPPRLSESKLNS